ncbi:MAG: hypothetical protein A2W90_22025 [Bacteroidetes bacterium GWF2_42_66]|nr:MAG: hypothetical protein A2W92_04840 [Bacteroidetes bacterium GWA2_42_15]OFY03235.1 MAG: hypothetical protein A2W89_18835 [Bacteroidetes bacterium GWE2_42_39]OFY45715.1 MAG: hypothetical protein A2W90_22025 [Bacteroidetes bacterium GWF2_42_66]HBL77292.1 hypothetical protein [Prolixibacteraceae bacterium]HCU62450.1 hypothetical protein [Prolixibacteraceae bacterium]
MKIIRYTIVYLILVASLSCSMQSKFTRQFKGMSKTELDEYFGQKGVIVPLSSDKKYVAYTQTKILRSTAINKGVTTLDPMVSPSVEKRQKFIFYLDSEDKVSECKYDAEYQH